MNLVNGSNRVLIWACVITLFTSCNVPELNSQAISTSTGSLTTGTPTNNPVHTPTPTVTPSATATATPAGTASPAATPTNLSSRTVMVGYGGRKMTTLDGGTTWALNHVDVANGGDDTYLYRGVSYGNHLFVAVGNRIDTSPDGISWTNRVTGISWIGGSAFGNSRWVAVGGCGARWNSSDGITWTELTNDFISIGGCGHLRTVVFGNGIFLAVGDQNIEGITQNGTDWTINQASSTYTSPVFANNRFYAIDTATGALVQSTVVNSSTSTYTNWTPNWTAVSGVPNSGFVALTQSGVDLYASTAYKIYVSADAVTWATINSSPNGPVVASQSGKFLSYAWESLSQSSNLTNWTSVTTNPSMLTNGVNAFVTSP